MIDALEPFLAATIRTAVPLAFAALGEMLVERTGLINIGLEGAILAGAFGALVGASSHGVALGFVGAIAAGMLVASLFACLRHLGARGPDHHRYRPDAAESGRDRDALSSALRQFRSRAQHSHECTARDSWPGGASGDRRGALRAATRHLPRLPSDAVCWPGGSLARTPASHCARLAIAPRLPRRRAWPWTAYGRWPSSAGGALGGLAGGTLVLAQAGTFTEGMSAGRGFIAIAIVVLGRWTPFGVVAGALLFGAASALQFAFQAMGWSAPYQVFLATPYVLTLAALAGAVGRARPPASLGQALEPRR